MTNKVPATGYFAAWWNLPFDEEYSKTVFQWFIIMNVLQFFLFFVVAENHPLPAKLAAKLKKPYDRMVVGHRLVCAYNGFGAFLVALYWVIFIREIECGKKNSLYETILFCNMCAHFIWDSLFMKYKGFLDFGNFLHHFMGTIVYGSGIYFQHNLYLNMMHIVAGDATNAAMHFREILKRFGLRYSLSYYTNEYYYSYTYMFCRGVVIPALFYFYWSCDSTGPFFMCFYPPHVLQNFYYVSQLPKMIRVRKGEEVKLKKAKHTLRWFEGVSAEAAKEAGIGNFEAYKM
jgi:hypothetical protein